MLNGDLLGFHIFLTQLNVPFYELLPNSLFVIAVEFYQTLGDWIQVSIASEHVRGAAGDK